MQVKKWFEESSRILPANSYIPLKLFITKYIHLQKKVKSTQAKCKWTENNTKTKKNPSCFVELHKVALYCFTVLHKVALYRSSPVQPRLSSPWLLLCKSLKAPDGKKLLSHRQDRHKGGIVVSKLCHLLVKTWQYKYPHYWLYGYI